MIKLSGIPNDGTWDGTFQVLLYTGQRFLKDFEVKTKWKLHFNKCRIFSDQYIEVILKQRALVLYEPVHETF